MNIASSILAPPVERRYSCRWATDKLIAWRMHGHASVRQGRLVERSLNGLVILTPGPSPPVGALMRPANGMMAQRHGFRLAVLRRIQPRTTGQCLLCLEILS